MTAKRIGVAVLWAMIACVVLGGIRYFESAPRYRKDSLSFPIMSTRATVTLIDPDSREIERGFRAARTAMEKVVKLCNYFDPESELGKLNASAAEGPFRCSPQLWEILQECRRYHRISNGAFDPTIRPLMKVWGFRRARKTLPSPEEIAEAKKICGWDKIQFDDRLKTVRFDVPGLSIDLGGIAKGWAVDKAVEAILKESSIRRGFVDLGGNLRTLPLPPPGRENYRIAIRDPKSAERQIAVVAILNESIATSGDYERYVVIDGKRYTHIVNPVTGVPVDRSVSATVVAPRGVDADALSTTLFINGPAFAGNLDRSVRTFLIDSSGKNHSRVPEGSAPFVLLPESGKP